MIGLTLEAFDGEDGDLLACDGDGFFVACCVADGEDDVGAFIAFEAGDGIVEGHVKGIFVIDFDDDVAGEDASVVCGGIFEWGDDA